MVLPDLRKSEADAKLGRDIWEFNPHHDRSAPPVSFGHPRSVRYSQDFDWCILLKLNSASPEDVERGAVALSTWANTTAARVYVISVYPTGEKALDTRRVEIPGDRDVDYEELAVRTFGIWSAGP